MKASVVVFNYLGPRESRSARRWLREGVRVLYVNADPSVCLNGFETLPMPHDIWSDSALSLVDAIYRAKIEDTRHLAWARKLFKSEDIAYAFRRFIMSGLIGLYKLMDGIGRSNLHPDGTIYLVAGPFEIRRSWDPFIFWFLDLIRSGQLDEREVKNIPFSVREVMSRIRIKRVSGFVSFFRDLAQIAFFLISHQQFSKHPRERFYLAIHTYATGWGTAEEMPGELRLRNVDFLVDGVNFHTGNTMFCAGPGVPEVRIQALKKRGFCVALDSKLGFDPAFTAFTVLPALRDYLIYRFFSGFRGVFESQVCRELFYAYLRTRAFAEYFAPRYFFFYNDFSSQAVCRTIVLEHTGCASVFYQHTSFLLIEGIESVFAYFSFSVVATWGRVMSAYYQKLPGRYKESWEVGCIWSEFARLVREDHRLRAAYRERIETYAGHSLDGFTYIVSVFDTTINPLFTLEDFAAFVSDMAWIASEFPDICVLYKPKYDIKYMSEQWANRFRGALEELRKVRNFIVLPAFFETAAAVGLADLTISACFTSTAVESAGCGIKALYYDPSDRNRPESEWGAFWHRIPGLICRSREQLKARVQELLFQTTDEEYRAYLRRHFSHVEGHQDGRSITRLRQRLLDGINNQGAGVENDG